MLEGRTIIELTDVHTGEKEVHEDKNMITNAMNEIFGTLPSYINYGGDKSYLNKGSNLITELFGGILLFDKALPEDANQLIAPAGTQLVGCGAYGTQNNTKGKCRGNYNQTESEFNQSQKYMKFVYDFATSQANGTIASLALTSKKGGFVSYGGENDTIFVDTNTNSSSATMDYTSSRDKTFYSSGYMKFVASKDSSDYVGVITSDRRGMLYNTSIVATIEFLFALDIDNDVAYYFKLILNASNEITGFKIIKRAIPIKSISLFNNMVNTKPLLEEKEVSLSTPVKYDEDLAGYNFDTTTNCLFFHTTASTHTNGITTVVKISLNGDIVNVYKVVNNTGHRIYAGAQDIFCLGEYMYAMSYETNVYQTYKIKLNNPADVLVIPSANGSNYRVTFNYQIGKRLYSQNGKYVLDTELNKIFFCELMGGCYNSSDYREYHTITPVINHDLIKYVACSTNSPYYGLGFLLHGCYLATINNLSQPVTKTADKTMKITYIIKEK